MATDEFRSNLDQHSTGEVITEISGWLVAGGVITFALFPLALPFLLLTVVAVLPLVLIPLALGLAAIVVVTPFLLVLGLGRWAIRGLRGGTSEESRHESRREPARAQ